MGYVTDVQIGNNIYPVGSSLYGTCATEAGTAAKVVTMSNFDTLKTGVTIHVKFTYSNSVADPTLNVNNTGAKSIYRFATISPGSTIYEAWNAGAVVSFTYDGDAWIMNESMNYDATKLPLTGGTLSGHLNVQVAGEAIVKTVNSNSGGLTLYLDTATENHGLVSNGYYNSSTSTFTSDPIWMIVRQNNGNIYVNGHSTLDLPLTGGTLTGNLTVQKAGETQVKVINTSSGNLTCMLDTSTENHGIWSTGYYNNSTSTFTSDAKWMIYRNYAGDIIVNGHATSDLALSGGIMTGDINMSGSNINLKTPSGSSDDCGDIVFYYGNGQEKSRIWVSNTYTSKSGPNYRVYNSSGTSLYSGTLPLADGTGASGTWNIHASSDLALTGGTLTGNLTVQRTGENAYIIAKSNDTSVSTYLHSDTGGTHGVYSNGYWNGTAFTSSGKRLVYRDTAGNVYCDGHATLDLPLTGGTLSNHLVVSKAGEAAVKTTNTSSGGLTCQLDTATENHGIWSTGYYDNSTSTFTASGTWMIYRNKAGTVTVNGNVTGSAATAGALNTIASVSGSSHAVALQTYFNNNHANIPRNKLINFYSSAYNNGSLAMGYFLAGNDSSPYGGFFVAHYSNAYYVGISNGAYSEQKILTSTNYSGYALPLSGGTITGSITYKTAYNAAAANNGLSSGTGYPTTVNILDSSSRIMARLEGVINSNGSIGSYWYVRNYDTSGTNTGQKGIAMHMAKNGTLTYTVGDPANFRSAISAFSTGGGTITGSLTIKPASGNAGIELYGTAPYIDFHYNYSTTNTDYCPRLQAVNESQLRLASQTGTPQFCVQAADNLNIAYLDATQIISRRSTGEARIFAQAYTDSSTYCQLYMTANVSGVRGIYAKRLDGTNHWMMHFANNSSTGTFYGNCTGSSASCTGHAASDLALTGGTLTGALTCNSSLAVVGNQTNTGWIFLRGSDPSIFFANNQQTSWTNRIQSVSQNILRQTSTSGNVQYQIYTTGTNEASCLVQNGGHSGALLASNGNNLGIYSTLSGKTGWLIKCTNAGAVTVSTSVSDIRLKENIEPTDINNALDIVNSMKIRQFDWKTDGTHQKIGFVADELEEIDEHLAFGGGLDEFGNLDKKNVDTFYLLGYLTKAIQELSAENEKLKARISDVERRYVNG